MKSNRERFRTPIILIIPCVTFLYSQSVAEAGILGTAQSFAVLAGSTVTNSGLSTINGDLGVWPGSAYAGGGTVTQTGSVYLGNGVAQTAEGIISTAYNAVAGMAVNTVLTGTDLGGLTLHPGVYFFSSSAQLTGTLTLDAQGDPNAMFAFQIGSTLTTSVGSAVNVINGGAGTGVFWQVGSSATLGTNTTFAGNILALASISLNSGATIQSGRALAQNGAVTLIGNTISDSCTAGCGGRGDFGSFGFAGNTIQTTPEPESIVLAVIGLIGMAFCKRRYHDKSFTDQPCRGRVADR